MRFWGCKFCGGRGCLACPAEADKAYEKEFPNGPEPIATFKLDSPEDMEAMGKAIGQEAMDKALGPDGGGIWELMENLEKEMQLLAPESAKVEEEEETNDE